MALSFSLQRYLGEINTPVPAFLAFDQISRPCYPQREVDDSTVGRTKPAHRVPVRGEGSPIGFRVLLIVLAFFCADPVDVAFTCMRWNKLSEEALIPHN
nr:MULTISPECIES: DUF3732 domain-containing protein [unclassified Pseudomonas]